MSAGTLPSPVAVADPPSKPQKLRSPWIGGPLFDSFFFLFPVLFSIGYIWVYMANQSNLVVVSALNTAILALGVFHGCGTLCFYLDKDNFAVYSKQKFRFFVAPVLIWVATAAISVAEWVFWTSKGRPTLFLVPLAVFIWGSYHVTRQNVGFVAFYRSKCGVYDDKQRRVDNGLIYSNALLMYWLGLCFMFSPWYMPPMMLTVMKLLAIPMGIGLVVSLLVFLHRRWNAPAGCARLSWQHSAMMAIALVFPAPLFFTVFSNPPTFLMFSHSQFGLMAHYVQYIALVGLLHFHKYPSMLPSPEGHDGQPAQSGQWLFGRLPINGVWVALIFCSIITIIFVVLLQASQHSSIPLLFQIANGLLLGFALVHYFLDAYMWRMRDEHTRKGVLPYLKPLGR